MELIALTDIHGQLDHLYEMDEIFAGSDGILLAGDITNFGGRREIREVLDEIRKHNPRIVGVFGNCDLPEVEPVLNQFGYSVHGQCQKLGGVQFVGVGGSLPCPGMTPNEAGEEEFQRILDHAISGANSEPLVLITHQPAYGTALDSTGNGCHVGSKTLRTFIEEYQPLLALSGHIHEAPGTDCIGKTLCVNPGPLRNGSYAKIFINNEIAKAELLSL